MFRVADTISMLIVSATNIWRFMSYTNREIRLSSVEIFKFFTNFAPIGIISNTEYSLFGKRKDLLEKLASYSDKIYISTTGSRILRKLGLKDFRYNDIILFSEGSFVSYAREQKQTSNEIHEDIIRLIRHQETVKEIRQREFENSLLTTIQNLVENLAPISYKDELTTDPYDLLGIKRNATKTDIKRAHRTLSHNYHPDKLKDIPPHIVILAEEHLKKINIAYEFLIGQIN